MVEGIIAKIDPQGHGLASRGLAPYYEILQAMKGTSAFSISRRSHSHARQLLTISVKWVNIFIFQLSGRLVGDAVKAECRRGFGSSCGKSLISSTPLIRFVA